MAKLRPMIAAFFGFITTKKIGDIVNKDDLLTATGWSPVTLTTHEKKNALAPFLEPLGGGRYRVRRDGGSISQNEVSDAFTQIRPTEFRLSPGTKVKGLDGTYDLVSELGRGAVAHVWKAKRLLNGVFYAVKIMNPRADLLDPKVFDDVKRRFKREAQNGRHITNDHIVSYVDTGEYDNHPFLVMELADETLSKRLASGKLAVDESIKVIHPCALGLSICMTCPARIVT